MAFLYFQNREKYKEFLTDLTVVLSKNTWERRDGYSFKTKKALLLTFNSFSIDTKIEMLIEIG